MDEQNQNNQPAVVTPDLSTTITPTPSADSNPTSVPPASASMPVPPAPKKSKKGLIVALIIVLILVAGAAAYFLVFAKNDDASQKNTTPAQADTEVEPVAELKKTTYTTHKKSSNSRVSVTVEHPADWKVEQDPEEEVYEGFMANGDMRIISPRGNVLSLSDKSFGGRGGDCSEEHDITLVKKIQTKNTKYVFIEFKDNAGDSAFLEKLNFTPVTDTSNLSDYENLYKNDILEYNALKEGETFTGDCRAAMSYPSVKNAATGNEASDSVIDVKVIDGSGEEVSYDQIKGDTEFIALLESLDTSGDQ